MDERVGKVTGLVGLASMVGTIFLVLRIVLGSNAILSLIIGVVDATSVENMIFFI